MDRGCTCRRGKPVTRPKPEESISRLMG
jgi:hypothetical protein